MICSILLQPPVSAMQICFLMKDGHWVVIFMFRKENYFSFSGCGGRQSLPRAQRYVWRNKRLKTHTCRCNCKAWLLSVLHLEMLEIPLTISMLESLAKSPAAAAAAAVLIMLCTFLRFNENVYINFHFSTHACPWHVIYSPVGRRTTTTLYR